jgi:uncharacterized protein
MAALQLDLSEDKSQVQLSWDHKSPLCSNEQEILAQLAENYPDLQILNDTITQLIEQSNHINDTEADETTETEIIILAQRVDHQVDIKISDDQMQVILSITKGFGSPPLKLANIVSQLKKSNVVYGINKKSIRILLKRVEEGENASRHRRIVARGKDPIKGTETQFTQIADTLNDRSLKPDIDDNSDSANLRDLGGVPQVKPGDELMRRTPASVGGNGCTVTNQPVNPEPVEDLPFSEQEGAVVSDDDPNLLVAQITGLAELSQQGMSVKPVLIVENVDLATGNIDFDGTVIVEGDVREDMQIKSTGDVRVEGFVDHAHIETQGNIFVGHGVLGTPLAHGEQITPDKNLKTFLSCQGECHVHFAQFVEIHAGGNIFVKELLLHSRVTSNQSVIVGEESNPKGNLIGGITKAHDEVNVNSAGAPATIITRIDFSSAYQAAKKQLQNCEDTLDEHQKTLIYLNQLLKKLGAKETSPDVEENIAKVRLTRDHTETEIKNTEAQCAKLTTEMDNISHSKLIFNQVAHSGVIVEMLDQTYQIRSSVKAGSLFYQGKEIRLAQI